MPQMTHSDILLNARKALSESPIQALRNLSVEETAVGLVISGSVSSFYYKQMAQESIRSAVREKSILNTVHVS